LTVGLAPAEGEGDGLGDGEGDGDGDGLGVTLALAVGVLSAGEVLARPLARFISSTAKSATITTALVAATMVTSGPRGVGGGLPAGGADALPVGQLGCAVAPGSAGGGGRSESIRARWSSGSCAGTCACHLAPSD
jgi:hypothetical protein